MFYIDIYSFGDELEAAPILGQSGLIEKASLDAFYF
jgi:hypothetical protein